MNDFSWLGRTHELWVAAIAVVCSVACALPGSYLVLRRLSLLGDAISHSVLPGLALAFVITASRAPVPMLVGALAAGVVSAVASSALHRWGRVPEDAALGVVFSTMFAIGVILITAVASNVDLDANCVLYGLIEMAPFDSLTIGGVHVPVDFVWLTSVMVVNAALIFVFFKELQVVCFDPALATSMGISAGVVHYGLIGVVAATTVASFEAVGSILVVTMLIAPGATAHLLTEKLGRYLLLSSVLAATAAVLGVHFAIAMDSSVAGMISVVAGVLFGLVLIAAPHHGLAARAIRRLSLSVRIAREDILGALYRTEEGADVSSRRMPTGWLGRIAAWSLGRRQLVERRVGALVLTDKGRLAARHLVRSHRLWEAWLADNSTLPPDHLHDPAERIEHFITPALERELTRAVERETDPHGKAIP